MKSSIRAILFDMVGVLIFPKKGYKPTTIDQHNADSIERLFNHIDDQQLLLDIKNILHLDTIAINKGLSYIPKKYEMFSDLWAMLPRLKHLYKLGIINNGNSLALPYWKKQFDYSPFSIFINSAEVKFKKPDAKIFLLACKKLSVRPSECLFMDDLHENILAAKSLGMKTIWWDKTKNKTSHLKLFSQQLNANFIQ